MTPAARVAAAISILDAMDDGLAAEQALTRWARQNRYAGSKDRAAVRDHIFDVLRAKHLVAHLGNGTNGRALMLGLTRLQNGDVDAVFSGEGYGPPAPTPEEKEGNSSPLPRHVEMNIPEWLLPEFDRSLSDNALSTAKMLQDRAPVTLRVNTLKTSIETALSTLQDAGISVGPNSVAPNALTVIEGARKLRNSEAYKNGWVELQDAASQAVVDGLPAAQKCLDFCAGGGGKTLALASDITRDVYAHDIDPRRMVDLGPRAMRAGASVTQLGSTDLHSQAPFDLVLCDAPCSGSGAWRRAPEGKWTLTADRLAELTKIQFEILCAASELVQTKGTLAYATCSVLKCENEEIIARFLEKMPGWHCKMQRRFDLSSENDGFFVAHLTQV